MKPRYKRKLRLLRRPFEWAGIALAFVSFVFLPRRILLKACDAVSSVMYFFDKRGRAYAFENLRTMYGDLPRHADIIVKRSYRNMARTVGYAIWTCIRARKRAAASGEMSPEGKALLAANRQAVTVSGHIGCWEILSQLAFLEGHMMMSIAKDIGSKGMTRLLMHARKSIGQEIVSADGAMKALLSGVREGKSLGLLVDQCVDPRDGGIWVRFFGRPVPVSVAPAFFAAKGSMPILTAWSRPLKDGRWRCEVIASYPAGSAKDMWLATQRCIADLEKTIRRHPSCWILNYRYFRKKVPPADLEKLEKREKALAQNRAGKQDEMV